MREISLELEHSNSFVQSFIAMKHHCQRAENQNKEICMLIKVSYYLDLRLFNDTVQTDVTVNGVGESANFRPDIMVRVFKSKLKALIEGLMQKNIFCKVEALIFTIAFRKRL